MARAWSVGEVKGLMSCVASQSNDGTVSLGKFAAWVSGLEKSRHVRQAMETSSEGCEYGVDLGLVVRSFDRSGLDDAGIGGGAPLPVLEMVLFTLFFGSCSCGLFIPNESADRAGITGGCSGGSSLTAPFVNLRIGV